MLLRFGVSNFHSIHEFQEVSLVAHANLKEMEDQLLSWDDSPQKVLRVWITFVSR